MRNYRYMSEAAVKARERREREDQCARLAKEVPLLRELRLDIEERHPESAVAGTRYTRVVVVPSAAALFELTCGDTGCKDGGHDLTREILGALTRGKVEFSGESSCRGQLGTADCRRLLKYQAVARYEAALS
ncbi:MAG: hypothetical protein SFV15_07665 [Polyangiaceae bacterium]|nr:hypothetical protein [Polyangiaceae bacterium]